MTPEDEALARIEAHLEDIKFWLRILAEPQLRERLEANLRDRTERLVYQASTGGSTRDIEALTGVSKSSVAAMWARWSKAGIVASTATQGRYARLASLDQLNMEV